MSNAIRALGVRIGDEPHAIEIKDELVDFQAYVGGYVEAVDLGQGLTLWCNEEAILLNLPINRGIAGTLHPAIGMVIRGDFFVTASNDAGDVVSLTEEQLAAVRSLIVEVVA